MDVYCREGPLVGGGGVDGQKRKALPEEGYGGNPL